MTNRQQEHLMRQLLATDFQLRRWWWKDVRRRWSKKIARCLYHLDVVAHAMVMAHLQRILR